MRFYRVCGHTSYILQLEERPWSASTAFKRCESLPELIAGVPPPLLSVREGGLPELLRKATGGRITTSMNGKPGPSRRSDCAVGARAFKSRSLPGCDSPQGRVAAPVRAPIARGPRPARACRTTLARGLRASTSFYHPALDPVLDQRGHDPSGHAHRPVGRRCGA